MKKIFLTALALMTMLAILVSAFASCTVQSEETSKSESETVTTNNVTESEYETTDGNSSENESESESETEDVEKVINKVSDKNDPLIELSNSLSNGVQAFFTNANRTHYSIQNTEMTMNYSRSNQHDQLVESIKNTKGTAYIQNTMDVFVRMTDGSTHYASKSTKSAETNLYRFGYYYYEGLFEFQNFVPKSVDADITAELGIKKHFSGVNGISVGMDAKNTSAFTYTITEAYDPQIKFAKNISYSLAENNVMILSARALGNTTYAMIYIDTGSGFNETQLIKLSLINDGEYHTYHVSFQQMPGYSDGTLKGIRIDPNGNVGAGIAIESLSLGKSEPLGEIPVNLSINRHFHVYSDKMHHVIQFAATEKTNNIAEVGMLTEIPIENVSKIIVVTDDGKTYDSLSLDVSWETVVAVGFDVTDAGIFGFILPDDDIAGKIKVKIKDGVYVIEQTRTPVVDDVSGVIIPSINTEEKDEYGNYKQIQGITNNGNDFYLGQRIYTDEGHDFTEFLQETYFERNPIDEKRISITGTNGNSSAYKGYDAIRGIYTFEIETPINGMLVFNSPNKDYKIDFKINSDEDRNVYVMTTGLKGSLECATLLDEDQLLLPVPIEVIKNYSEPEGEKNLFNINDPTFSEAIFCLSLTKGIKQEYTIINLYQNWGNYPLKQLSQIPFHCPYYHLSTGLTETNCILPWFTTENVGKVGTGNTLPDFRGMSSPGMDGTYQHSSCGSHYWLEYTDSEGKFSTTESIKHTITSYGPTYAEVIWDNISDDGKIKVTYTHMEMPQVDENRTYYTMEYVFLEDLTINNFKDNFQFYSVTDNDSKGSYKKLGYLNDQNKPTIVESNQDTKSAPEYILGDACPYFSFFMMPDWNRESTFAEGYANVAFLIYNSEFIIGGVEKDYRFLIKNPKDYVTLTLNESGTIEFMKGDKITINAILMPWGSQELEDDAQNRLNEEHTIGYTEYSYNTRLPDGSLYMDKNVRDVRENSLLNPLTVTSETDKIIDSPFLPKVKSKDGKTAEFTLLGGENNVVVRIYGFERLTAPKVEEFVNGEWQEYVLSSHKNPDVNGYYHYYDGYMVYYDEDGTYSYAFVTTMTNGAPRMFRISADTAFEGWPLEQEPPRQEDPLKVYSDSSEIAQVITDHSRMFGTPVLVDDENGISYTSVYVKLDNPYNESFATFYTSPIVSFESGQYLVIKYRVPSTNKENVGRMEVFSTTDPNAVETTSGCFTHTLTSDGEWHVDVIDLSQANLKTYSQNSTDAYCAKFLRLDIYNTTFSNEDTHIDFAYIGIDSDLSTICELERGKIATLNYYVGSTATKLDVATATPVIITYLDPSSGYTESDAKYASILDRVTTEKGTYNNSSIKDITTYIGAKTDANGIMNLYGWCAVNGGVEKYVYSVDGGKTWIDCIGTPINAGNEIIESAQKKIGTGYVFDDREVSKINGSFQNANYLKIDLAPYADQQVNVIFAAVSKADTSKLILLYYFKDVECKVVS